MTIQSVLSCISQSSPRAKTKTGTILMYPNRWLLATCLALVPLSVSAGPTSPLVAVEQQRSSLAARLSAQWATEFASLPATRHRTHEQLASSFYAIRSDRLFAISLASSVEDIESILIDAERNLLPGRMQTKAIGDAASDLVYTPVTPCRIVDTRLGAGGTLAGGDTRHWFASNPSGSFALQGGSSSDCGIPVKPAAVLLNITVANTGAAPSFLVAWPYGQARPNASTINWATAGTQIANAIIVPSCIGGSCAADFSAFAASSADVIIDVAGYFAAPAGSSVTWVTSSGVSLGPIIDHDDAWQMDYVYHLWRSAWGPVRMTFVRSPSDTLEQWRLWGVSLYFASLDCSGQAYIFLFNGLASIPALRHFVARSSVGVTLQRRQSTPISQALPTMFDGMGNAAVSRTDQSTGACVGHVAKSTDLFHPVDFAADLTSVIVEPITLR